MTTVTDLQNRINAIQAQIASLNLDLQALQAELAAMSSTSGTSSGGPTSTSGGTTSTSGGTTSTTGSTATLTAGSLNLSIGQPTAPNFPNLDNGGWVYDKTTGVSLRFFADGGVLIENNLMGATADAVLSGAVLSVDGTTLFSGDLTLPPNTSRIFWATQPVAKAPDLIKFFTYGTPTTTPDYSAKYASSDPLTRMWTTALDTTGSRPDISPEAGWDVAYLVNPTSANASVVRGMSDAFATCPCQFIDPATGDFISLATYPTASAIGPQRGNTGNPIAAITQTSTTWNLSQAQAHAPEVGHVAYWAFGTQYDQWINAAWTLYTAALWIGGGSNGYRLNGGNGPAMLMHVQPRGEAWGLRNLVQAATMNSPYSAMFNEWVGYQLADMQAYCDSHAGLVPVDLLWVDQAYATRRYDFRMNSFMNDFMVMALAYAYKVKGFTAAQSVGQYFGAFPVQRMTQPIAPQNITMPQLTTIYEFHVATSDNNFVADWAATIAASIASGDTGSNPTASVLGSAVQLDPTSQAFQNLFGNQGHNPGDFICDSPTSDTNYAARLGTVLNCCKILGVSGVDNALSVYNQYQRVDWADPQWYILP